MFKFFLVKLQIFICTLHFAQITKNFSFSNSSSSFLVLSLNFSFFRAGIFIPLHLFRCVLPKNEEIHTLLIFVSKIFQNISTLKIERENNVRCVTLFFRHKITLEMWKTEEKRINF